MYEKYEASSDDERDEASTLHVKVSEQSKVDRSRSTSSGASLDLLSSPSRPVDDVSRSELGHARG